MMRTEPVIEHDEVAADLHQVSRAHAPHRRRRRSGSKQARVSFVLVNPM